MHSTIELLGRIAVEDPGGGPDEGLLEIFRGWKARRQP
jgi:hypothetical protein